MPKISVIVPVYNVEPYLRKCIDSILNQSFTDFELILVDDGSTDASGSICDDYAKYETRIRVFHTINRGLSAARNLGIDEAKSNWICFVDSDDWIESNYLSAFMDEPLEENVLLIQKISMDDATMDDKEPVTYMKTLEVGLNDKHAIYANMFGNGASACAKLYNLSLIRRNKLYFKEELIAEDIMFLLTYLSIVGNVRLLPFTAYHYMHYNRPSVTRSIHSSLVYIRLCELLYKQLEILKCNQGIQKIGFDIEKRIHQHINGFWHAAGKNVVRQDYKDVFCFMRNHKTLVKLFGTISIKYRLFHFLLFNRLLPDEVLFGLLNVMKKISAVN